LKNKQQERPELRDHEVFRRGLEELHRIVNNRWLSTLAQIATLAGIFGTPFLAARMHRQASTSSVVDTLLILLAALQILDVNRHYRTKTLTAQLTKQSQHAARRADTLYDLAVLDPLTGLHNRRFAEERLDEEIARAEKTNEPLALLLIDLDYFKPINDRFGHATGDLALKEFSRRLKRAIRSCDVPARIGGDEFLVILPDCPRDKVDTILARIGAPQIRADRQLISVCYSVGRAHYQVCDTSKAMLARADGLLYEEKAKRPRNSAGESKRAHAAAGQELAYARYPMIQRSSE
jgi:diguanylate cyclase (GGDEF)-like protein